MRSARSGRGTSTAPGTCFSTYSSGLRTSSTAAPARQAASKASVSTSGTRRWLVAHGAQPFHDPRAPASSSGRHAEPVVQAARPALPQLAPSVGHDAVAAPERADGGCRRPGSASSVAATRGLQHGPVGDDRRTAGWPTRRCGCPADGRRSRRRTRRRPPPRPCPARSTWRWRPSQRSTAARARVRGQLATLPALPVREEHEAVSMPLRRTVRGRRHAVGVDGGDHHGRRLGLACPPQRRRPRRARPREDRRADRRGRESPVVVGAHAGQVGVVEAMPATLRRAVGLADP